MPRWQLLHLLLVVALASNEVAGQAVAVEVVVALRLDEHVSLGKAVEADDALPARQVALSQTLSYKLGKEFAYVMILLVFYVLCP